MKIFISILVIFFSLLSTSQATGPSLKLALNWKPEPQFGGFYTAEMMGFFEKQNLKVQIQEGGSGTPTVQMLAAGKIEYAVVSADEIILAHDRGAKDLVAIFAVYQTNPQGIMTHAARNFTKIEEVFKSDGTLLWQSGLPYAQFILKNYGPFNVKTAPYLGGIGNFQKDPKISQQCFVTSEPLTAETAGLKVKTFLVADTGYNPYTTVVA
ncbi:MAG: ABC transporter substrate-binding protein, partial [Pseudobdellovibrionaceae bacterium]